MGYNVTFQACAQWTSSISLTHLPVYLSIARRMRATSRPSANQSSASPNRECLDVLLTPYDCISVRPEDDSIYFRLQASDFQIKNPSSLATRSYLSPQGMHVCMYQGFRNNRDTLMPGGPGEPRDQETAPLLTEYQTAGPCSWSGPQCPLTPCRRRQSLELPELPRSVRWHRAQMA